MAEALKEEKVRAVLEGWAMQDGRIRKWLDGIQSASSESLTKR